MHYEDYISLTDAARSSGGRTMVAKRANCDLRSPHSTLTDADISILNKMYCTAEPENVVKSPNYPQNYPDNQDKEYRLEVATGSTVKLTFTYFELEPEPDCKYRLEVATGSTVKLTFTYF